MADSDVPPNKSTDNPSKYYKHFLLKALVCTLFLVLLPLFPSQAPEFLSQSLNTRIWEILQLILVGIVVSYGLFSWKTDELDKENESTPKFDNAHSYVSGLLQVPSVFDDESEGTSVFDENSDKIIQTWNNQYHRGEPVVVMAKEFPALEEQRGVNSVNKISRIGEKPLLLPVRSLKSRVAEPQEINGFVIKEEENLALPSPIPWRSRSGRMEMNEVSSLPLSMEDPEFNKLEPTRSFRSQSFRSSPSPNKLRSSLKNPSESQVRITEEMPRKKTPTPPPPPLHSHGKSSMMKSSSTEKMKKSEEDASEKELRRSIRSVPMEVSNGEKAEPPRRAYSGRESQVFTGDATFPRTLTKNLSNRNENARENQEISVKKECVVAGSDDSDEDDFLDEGHSVQENCSDYKSGDDEGPDVDKKADEFIAKFREQIRLQRIDSIRRSTGKAVKTNL